MHRVVIVTIVALALASPAAAQNILVNPGLDTADLLFSDDFETGDLSRWSDVSP